MINDSKKLSDIQRRKAYDIIIANALAYSVQSGSVKLINKTNIDDATYHAMDKCIQDIMDEFSIIPNHIIVDGNRFRTTHNIPYSCYEKGDGRFLSIAAASIIAKVRRDDYMKKLHELYPNYGWNSNAGYHAKVHVEGLKSHGVTPYHRTQYVRNFI